MIFALTISAIGSRSCRMACMSWRLYFSTGVWPVWKDCAFAQPRPNRSDRLHLVELAIKDNSKFRASNVEFHLPKPSYTIDTLTYLKEKFPLEQFTVIMGSDSFSNIHRWKNYETLLANYNICLLYTSRCV